MNKKEALDLLYKKPLIALSSEERMDISYSIDVLSQVEYEVILDDIATLRLRKVYQSGEAFYDEKRIDNILWASWFNIMRKYTRLEPLKDIILNKELGDTIRHEALVKFRNECRDLANYGIMAVQITNQFIKEKDEQKDKSK